MQYIHVHELCWNSWYVHHHDILRIVINYNRKPFSFKKYVERKVILIPYWIIWITMQLRLIVCISGVVDIDVPCDGKCSSTEGAVRADGSKRKWCHLHTAANWSSNRGLYSGFESWHTGWWSHLQERLDITWIWQQKHETKSTRRVLLQNLGLMCERITQRQHLLVTHRFKWRIWCITFFSKTRIV